MSEIGKKQYSIEVILESDKDEVTDFMQKYFFKYEPIHVCLGFKPDTFHPDRVIKGLAHGCSFKAVNPAGEIVAIKLNSISQRNDPFVVDLADERMLMFMGFYKYIMSQYDVFDALNVNEVVEGKGLAVRPDYRGLGIATELYRRSTQWMQENNRTHMITSCTSIYTAHACSKLGYEKKVAIPFVSYKVDGVSPIVPKLPHTMYHVYLATVETL